MSRRSLSSRHSIDSCTIQLHSWRPFNSSDYHPHTPPPPKPYSPSSTVGLCPKRPCRSDRATAPFTIESIDMSRLSLFDDDRPIEGSLRLMAKKRRRRRGSRSVSGRSSDCSGTRRCCSVGATCSDLPAAAGVTDSSGELFGNGDWGSDASEAKNSRKDRDRDENPSTAGVGFLGQTGNFDSIGNELGCGSEPGYRVVRSSGTVMSSMRRRKTGGSCSGEIDLQMPALRWRWSGRTRSRTINPTTEAGGEARL